MEKMRIQKYCSQQGWASRRKTEELMQKGFVLVNGEVVTDLGRQIDPDVDHVEIKKEAFEQEEMYYFLVNKPRGLVSNLPQNKEREASELLPRHLRKKVHAVGRLDKDSEGLLFFTNDGVIANRLKSPEFNIEKKYEVKLDQELKADIIQAYAKGINLSGEPLKPVKVKRVDCRTYHFFLREGKNRQIRRMVQKYGYHVKNLKRLSMGVLNLKNLKTSEYRSLSEIEIKELRKSLGLN